MHISYVISYWLMGLSICNYFLAAVVCCMKLAKA